MKTIAFGILALVLAFFVSTSVVHGQTPTNGATTTVTPSPTTTSSSNSSTTMPKGAPNTGFGN